MGSSCFRPARTLPRLLFCYSASPPRFNRDFPALSRVVMQVEAVVDQVVGELERGVEPGDRGSIVYFILFLLGGKEQPNYTHQQSHCYGCER